MIKYMMTIVFRLMSSFPLNMRDFHAPLGELSNGLRKGYLAWDNVHKIPVRVVEISEEGCVTGNVLVEAVLQDPGHQYWIFGCHLLNRDEALRECHAIRDVMYRIQDCLENWDAYRDGDF